MGEQCVNAKENNFIKFKIGNHNWEIRFVPSKFMPVEKSWGFTYFQRKTIDIDDSLDYENAELTIAHEITHAVLMAHGRGYQQRFNQEEVCEFVSWNFQEIYNLVKTIMEARYGTSDTDKH